MLVRELRAHQVVFVLHAFDPRLALRLRVDHQRRTQRTRRQNTVLHGQLVVGQTLTRRGERKTLPLRLIQWPLDLTVLKGPGNFGC